MIAHRFSLKLIVLSIVAIMSIILVLWIHLPVNNNKDENDFFIIQYKSFNLEKQMCTYAVLRGLAALNHQNISTMICSMQELFLYFDVEAFFICDKIHPDYSHNIEQDYLQEQDLQLDLKINAIDGYAPPCSFIFFNHIRKHIMKDFTFKADIREYAQKTLSEIKGNRTKVTFVGIHAQERDYTQARYSWLEIFQRREVDMEFFIKATNYYKLKYSNVIFIAVCADTAWCKKHLNYLGVYVIDNAPSPAHNLAILANCNHTIMTYGFFGFWGSYLAGGDVVYFDNFLKPSGKFYFKDMYLPDWIDITTAF